MKKITRFILIFTIIFLILIGIVSYSLYQVKNKIDTCESRGWDGSEISLGKDFFGRESTALCNKAPETDTMNAVITKFLFWIK